MKESSYEQIMYEVNMLKNYDFVVPKNNKMMIGVGGTKWGT